MATVTQLHDDETDTQEHAADVIETTIEGPDDPDGQKTLIDRSAYQSEELQLPRVDGQDIDRIALTFTGTVFLDRSNPADVALYRSLTLQKDVTLMVEGKSNSTGAKGATDREGDLDVIIGTKGVKVATVYVPAAEAKAEEAA